MKEINILSPGDTKICSGSFVSSCFTDQQMKQYGKIKECNDTFKELKCENDGKRQPYILKGCDEIEPGHLQAAYDNKSKLNINLIDNELILDLSSAADLGVACTASIQELLTKTVDLNIDDKSNIPTGEEVSQGMDSWAEKVQRGVQNPFATPGNSPN